MPFIDHMQRNRFELKYIIDERCARGVRDFIRSYLVHDHYARPELAWAYPIYSVYVDSRDLALYNATLSGHKNRFKLRARYYDNNPASPVFFEIKRRANDVILKQRAAVKREAVRRLLAGAPPVREDLLDPSDPEAFASLEEFSHLRHLLNATGRAVVAYTREAWNAADNDDVRVTFDRRISGSWFDPAQPVGEALRPDRPWVRPPAEGGCEVVLELKFTGRYPNWMRELVGSFDLYRVTMAKYVNCVLAMGPHGPGLHRHRRIHHIRREALV